MKLAKYGYNEVAVATVSLATIAVVLWWLVTPVLTIIPAVAFALIIWFFRDPERTAPGEKNILVAPADGKIMDIEEVDEPLFLKQKAVRIGIFMSPLDVHLTRVPDSGKIAFIYYCPGRFLSAFNPRAKTENENNSIGLLLKREGRTLPIMIRQISGVLARRIVCKCALEDEVVRGQRVGMIKFGSRTEVYIPAAEKPEISVKIGEMVRSGETVVARIS